MQEDLLNSCSSELVCIERRGTSEILEHSEVFSRISSELVAAHQRRGWGEQESRGEQFSPTEGSHV